MWKKITAILKFGLCIERAAISGCCILYISPQKRRTSPQCTWCDNSAKERLSHRTERMPYKYTQGRRVEETLTHSSQTLSGLWGRYCFVQAMQSCYLTSSWSGTLPSLGYVHSSPDHDETHGLFQGRRCRICSTREFSTFLGSELLKTTLALNWTTGFRFSAAEEADVQRDTVFKERGEGIWHIRTS